jgi:hypothetical protein
MSATTSSSQKLISFKFLQSLITSKSTTSTATNQQKWTFYRTLTGKPYGGTVRGTVEFTQMTPQFAKINLSSSSKTGDDDDDVICLQYKEQGKFKMDLRDAEKLNLPSNELDVSQSYYWMAASSSSSSRKQNTEQDLLQVFFSDGRTFLNLDFGKNNTSSTTSFSSACCCAKDSHLCEKDYYHATFNLFSSQEQEQEGKSDDEMLPNRFVIEYVVQGPEKDYISKTVYEKK